MYTIKRNGKFLQHYKLSGDLNKRTAELIPLTFPTKEKAVEVKNSIGGRVVKYEEEK